MQRTPLIAANWKMNGSAALVEEMVEVLTALPLAEQAVVVCPPATLLTRFPALCNFALGGQTLSHEISGAFTGELSADLLQEAGARYLIVGHSERRALNGEGDELIAAKLARAVAAGLTPIFCIGESANISVPNGFSNVLWNTGAKTNTITVNTTGTYSVTVTDNFGCKGTSAINVNVSNLPNFTRTPNQVVCFEEIGSLDLEVNSSLRNNIVWINDFSTINKLTVANAGSYIFTVTNFDGCSKSDTILITERCTPRIFVPNAITPNGDGINDYFTAKGIAISNFEMYIFNRWGEEIYYTNDIEKGWDGTYMGNVVHVDVYVYKIYYTLDDKAGEYKREQMVGTVTVLR